MAPSASEFVAALLWLSATALIAVAAWRWARAARPDGTLLQTLVGTIVLAWSGIAAAAVVLGTVGLLSAVTLIGLVTVEAVSAILLHRHYARALPPGTASPPVVIDLLRHPGNSERYLLAAWMPILAWWLAHIMYAGLLQFPTDWDSLMYHIPLADQWLQEGRLYAPACAFWYNPGNNELLGFWLIAPFSGDFLIALNNLPAVLLFGAATVEFASTVGMGRVLAHTSALIALSTWPVLRQSVDAENDVAVAGLFVAGLGYGLHYARSRRRTDALLAALALGLLGGVKYYALGYFALCVAGLVCLIYSLHGARDALTLWALCSIGFCLLAGYWYLRNLLLTGTPIYPKGFTPSTDLWSEMRPGSWSSSFLGSGRAEVWPLAFRALGTIAGPCQVTAVGLVPATVLWLFYSGYRLHASGDTTAGFFRIALAVLLVGSGLVLGCTPNAVETSPGTMNMLRNQYLPVRFAQCFLCLAVVSMVVAIHDFSTRLNRMTLPGAGAAYWSILPAWLVRHVAHVPLALLTTAVGYQLVRHVVFRTSDSLGDSMALGLNFLMVAFVASQCRLPVRAARWLCPAGVVFLVIAGAFGIGALSYRWHSRFADRYDTYFHVRLFKRIETLHPVAGRICVCDYRYYPFFGSRRQFHVCRPLWLPTYKSLLAYLDVQGSTLIVARDHDPFPQGRYVDVYGWLVGHQDVFTPILTSGRYTLFAVNRNSLIPATESRSGLPSTDQP